MVIREFIGNNSRNRIGLIEEDPPKEISRELADFELYRFEESQLVEPGCLSTTSAVIFRQVEDKPTRIRMELEKYAPILLWHDCRVFVHPVLPAPGIRRATVRQHVINALNTLRLPSSGLSLEDVKLFDEWDELVDGRSLTPWVHVLANADMWTEVAKLLRINPPGRPPREESELEIHVEDPQRKRITLSNEEYVLLRRAFCDCRSVKLLGLPHGLSDVPAFKAFAHVDAPGTAGSDWPYLYFVKIGKRSKIAKEYLAYTESALEHVPYHLGPRLRLDRCALGQCQGILVSDYVSGAESLKVCARDGRAVPVIANLFNSTLWAWRKGATREPMALLEYLREKLSHPIPEHRQSRIEAYGSTMTLKELRTKFMGNDSQEVLTGIVHGDLHATNVLARSNDAILIDFEKFGKREPLLWDMASLEGGLFIDGFIGDHRAGKDLLESLDCLYNNVTLDEKLIRYHPSDESTWFFDCVRQIRMQARQIELVPHQYALILAAALAHKASNPKDFNKMDFRKENINGLTREDVRALAYILAERILSGLSI